MADLTKIMGTNFPGTNFADWGTYFVVIHILQATNHIKQAIIHIIQANTSNYP